MAMIFSRLHLWVQSIVENSNSLFCHTYKDSKEHWKYPLLKLTWKLTQKPHQGNHFFFLSFYWQGIFPFQRQHLLTFDSVIKQGDTKCMPREVWLFQLVFFSLFTCLKQWQEHRMWILKGSERLVSWIMWP